MAPFWMIGAALRSIAGSALGGSWLGVILNPYTLLLAGVVLLSGYSYQKGKQHERLAQARSISDLNKRVGQWQQAYEQADQQAETRLQSALDTWRRTMGARVVSAPQCKIDKVTAVTLAEIAGD